MVRLSRQKIISHIDNCLDVKLPGISVNPLYVDGNLYLINIYTYTFLGKLSYYLFKITVTLRQGRQT